MTMLLTMNMGQLEASVSQPNRAHPPCFRTAVRGQSTYFDPKPVPVQSNFTHDTKMLL
ncbi:hypothetical protein HanRHA438_Chr15g0729101 [Helianthus annuus]|nr:hypothetical protein HanRHA438_Chr15g0729101 [Helianthus annuus]